MDSTLSSLARDCSLLERYYHACAALSSEGFASPGVNKLMLAYSPHSLTLVAGCGSRGFESL